MDLQESVFDLDHYILKAESLIIATLKELGWTIESVLQESAQKYHLQAPSSSHLECKVPEKDNHPPPHEKIQRLIQRQSSIPDISKVTKQNRHGSTLSYFHQTEKQRRRQKHKRSEKSSGKRTLKEVFREMIHGQMTELEDQGFIIHQASSQLTDGKTQDSSESAEARLQRLKKQIKYPTPLMARDASWWEADENQMSRCNISGDGRLMVQDIHGRKKSKTHRSKTKKEDKPHRRLTIKKRYGSHELQRMKSRKHQKKYAQHRDKKKHTHYHSADGGAYFDRSSSLGNTSGTKYFLESSKKQRKEGKKKSKDYQFDNHQKSSDKKSKKKKKKRKCQAKKQGEIATITGIEDGEMIE